MIGKVDTFSIAYR